jgi:uncharacterized lipoprotein NlpE involved in copper resistance
MRRIWILLLMAPLVLGACATGKASKKGPAAKTGLPSEADSQAKEGRTFVGTLPCPLDCESIRTELTLFDAGRRFTMKETVIGSAVGELVIESKGEWSTVSGHGKDSKATVFELTSDQFEQERYFLKVNASTLRALDEHGRDIKSTKNVLLRLRR